MNKKWIFILLLMIALPLFIGCEEEVAPKEYLVSFSIVDEIIEPIKLVEGTILTESMLPEVIPSDEELLFHGWFFDDQFTMAFVETEIKNDMTLYGQMKSKPIKEEIIALGELNLPEEISESIVLPSQVGAFALVWESNNPSYLNHLGECVNTTSLDVVVTLTASIITTQSFEKEFSVIVKAYPFEEIFSEALSEVMVPQETSSDISLKSKFANDVVGYWESNKPGIISNTGKVTLTKQIEEVTLKLTLMKYEETYEKTYIVNTTMRPLTVNDYEYFVEQLSGRSIDVQSAIMTIDEIKMVNQTVLNTPATKTVNLETISEVQTKAIVYNLISSYTNFSKYSVYQPAGGIATDAEKTAILENRNLNGLTDEIAISYAVSTTHVNLRSYPTDFYSSSNNTDRFQETGFGLGIPMVIYHTSLDGQWFFVQMFHYYGWVSAKKVAFCTREQFLSYVNPTQFVVVIDSDFVLADEYIRMGTRLPYSSKTNDDYLISFPVRSCLGFLEIVDLSFTNNGQLSDGYLTYNYENLLSQAYKMLDLAYSWGDKLIKGFDCSSTQAAIYNCFGFQLGRNTSNQWVTNIYGGNFTSLSNETLKAYPVGTLLYTSGHVLMYIGYDESGNCWLLHNTSTYNKCLLQTLNQYGTSNIRYFLKLQDES